MEKILSIVIFTYNHEEYICKCIDSILKQQVDFDIEIIVADDCSTDKTVEVVRKNYGKSVQVWANEKNVGLCQNIYNAFRKVDGKYIYECAGDDYLEDEFILGKQVQFLETHPEYFSVTGWMHLINEMTGAESVKELSCSEYSMVNFLRGELPFFSMGVIRNSFKNDDVEYIKKASRNNEEIQIIYYTLKKGKKYILPQVTYTYCYRVSDGLENYCSTHDNLEMLSDYAKGFHAIEKWDNESKRYNFSFAKVKRYESFIDRILESDKKGKMSQLVRTIGIKDLCIFFIYKLIIRVNHRRTPSFLLNENRLIRKR